MSLPRPLAAVRDLVWAPVLLVQGRWVRWRTPRLPEPPGERAGRAGEGPPLRVLITGDSAAAGVGAASQAEALSGRLIGRLSQRFDVTWRLEAATGWDTARTVARLEALEPAPWDVLVTSLGVNDVTGGTATGAWLEGQRSLRSLARDRFGVRHFVVAGVPPMGAFPALPRPLRSWLGRRADALDAALAAELRDADDTDLLDLRTHLAVTDMATDGFHPGPAIYDAWARAAADRIAERWDGGAG